MAHEELILKKENSMAVITFNRPEVHNALNTSMVEQLAGALDDITADKEIRALILTGAGDKSFISGTDLSELSQRTTQNAIETSQKRQALFNRLESLGIPTIAAINGFAFGVGCEIALACTLRIASEKAKMGQLEINLGIIPGAGGSQRLPRLIGKARAAELILTGKVLNAREAGNIGLVNRVVAHDQLMSECRQLAAEVAQKSPVAVKYALRALNEGMQVDLASGLKIENLCLAACFSSEDGKEGLKAFIEKRKPLFKGY